MKDIETGLNLSKLQRFNHKQWQRGSLSTSSPPLSLFSWVVSMFSCSASAYCRWWCSPFPYPGNSYDWQLLCYCPSTLALFCVCCYQGMAWGLPIRGKWKTTRLELGLKRHSWHFFFKIDMLRPSPFQRVVSWKYQCPGNISFGSISLTVSWFSDV